MKKILAIFMIFTMFFTMVACGKENKGNNNGAGIFDDILGENDTTAPSGVIAETKQTEPSESESSALTPTGPEMTYDDQLAVIVENRGLWTSSNEEFFSSFVSVTVSDLDKNGRLEVQYGACVGTGFFTYMNVWEVNEDLSGMVAVERDYDEYYSQADVIRDDTVAYYDEDTRSFYYIFTDDARSGWAWNGSDIRAVCLKDGMLSEQTLASRSCETNNDYVSTTTYFDASGNEISEADYEAAASKHFAELHEMQVRFLWHNFGLEEFEALDEAQLLTKLQESLDAFSVS